MYESYANLKAGDGIVYYTTAGHVVMVATDAVVVRDPSTNKIIPNQSYITVLDQTATLTTGTNEAGDTFTYEANVDAKWSFDKLYGGSYLPFTFKEWTGEDPIEETEAAFSYQGDTITKEQLFSAKVTSNYHISDVYIYVYDEAGNEIYKHGVRTRIPSTKELKIHRQVDRSYTWGDWETVSAGNKVKVEVQLGTGERPVVWEGKIAAG